MGLDHFNFGEWLQYMLVLIVAITFHEFAHAVAADGLPYAGPIHPGTDRIHVITGLRKWGFTNGTAAAHVIAARLTGGESAYRGLMDPARAHVRAAVPSLVMENAKVGKHFVSDRVGSRIGTPSDAAWMTLFLASRAASWITGQTYPVNGGYSFAL